MHGLQIGQKFERYRVLQVLGSGVSGISYKAEDMTLHHTVALKLIHPWSTLADSARRQFFRDMQSISLLVHPYHAEMHDYGEIEGQLYIARRFVDNGSLLNSEGRTWFSPPFSVTDTLSYAHQLAQVLYTIHRYGYIHGSLTLSNILVLRGPNHADKPDFTPFLLSDIGLAYFVRRFGQPQITRLPITAAPEQWKGRHTPASDQYALAVLVYLWLAGRPPFIGSPEEIEQAKHDATFPLLSSFNPQIMLEQEGVMRRALSAYPDERYPTILSFIEALQTSIARQTKQQVQVGEARQIKQQDQTDVKRQIKQQHGQTNETRQVKQQQMQVDQARQVKQQHGQVDEARQTTQQVQVDEARQTTQQVQQTGGAKQTKQQVQAGGASPPLRQGIEPIDTPYRSGDLASPVYMSLTETEQNDALFPEENDVTAITHNGTNGYVEPISSTFLLDQHAILLLTAMAKGEKLLPELTPQIEPAPETQQTQTERSTPIEPVASGVLPPALDIAQPLLGPTLPNAGNPFWSEPSPRPQQTAEQLKTAAKLITVLTITSPYLPTPLEFHLEKGEITLGHAGSSDILLDHDQTTSRHHAMLQRRGHQYYVYDLQSDQGVIVNRQKLTPGVGYPLADGDRIYICSYTLTLYLIPIQYDDEPKKESAIP